MPCGLNAHVHGTAVRPEPRENDIRYDKMMVTTPRSIPVLWYTLSIDHHGSKVTFARLVRTQQCTLHIGMSHALLSRTRDVLELKVRPSSMAIRA